MTPVKGISKAERKARQAALTARILTTLETGPKTRPEICQALGFSTYKLTYVVQDSGDPEMRIVHQELHEKRTSVMGILLQLETQGCVHRWPDPTPRPKSRGMGRPPVLWGLVEVVTQHQEVSVQ